MVFAVDEFPEKAVSIPQNKARILQKQVSGIKTCKNKIFPLLIPFYLFPLALTMQPLYSRSFHLPPLPVWPTLPLTSTHSPSQWNLSAGVKAAGHLIIAAPVPERDQRWECPHRGKQPALLLQYRQLDEAVPHFKPKGPDPQQPEPKAVL